MTRPASWSARDPGDEAALEGLRVERGENIAQMVIGDLAGLPMIRDIF